MCAAHRELTLRVAIIVPYSWSYWGGVIDHAEQQAQALEALGVETQIIAGFDPPSRLPPLRSQPRRRGPLPDHVLSVGRTAPFPTNGSRSHIVLDPRGVFRLRRILARERFDLLHLHEPLVPLTSVAALAFAKQPVVATFHAAGALRWLKVASPVYGALINRIDCRIAVSLSAERSAARHFPGRYHVIANGTTLPDAAPAGGRDQRIVFIGRADTRKGLDVLLKAWPDVKGRTQTTLQIIGTNENDVRQLLQRHRLSGDGIEVTGSLTNGELTGALLRAKVLVAPSISSESFGMVLTRAFAAATPVIASDIDGYRDVVTTQTGTLVPPGDSFALGEAIVELLRDENRRQARGRAARQLAAEHYSWDVVGRRLLDLYEAVLDGRSPSGAEET